MSFNRPGELRDRMHAFGRAGDLLSILKAKARRALGIKLKIRTDG